MGIPSAKMLFSLFKEERWEELEHLLASKPDLFWRTFAPSVVLDESLSCLLLENKKTPASLVQSLIQVTPSAAFEDWAFLLRMTQFPDRLQALIETHPSTLFLRSNKQQNLLHLAFHQHYPDSLVVALVKQGLSLWETDEEGKKPFHHWLSKVVEDDKKAFIAGGSKEADWSQKQAQESLATLERWITQIPFDPRWWADRGPDKDHLDNEQDLLDKFNSMMSKKSNTLTLLESKEKDAFSLHNIGNPMWIQCMDLVECPQLLEWALEHGLNAQSTDASGKTLFHTVAQKLASVFHKKGVIPEEDRREQEIRRMMMMPKMKWDKEEEKEKEDENKEKERSISYPQGTPTYLDVHTRLLASWCLLASKASAMNPDYEGKSPVDAISGGPSLKAEVERVLLNTLVPEREPSSKSTPRL